VFLVSTTFGSETIFSEEIKIEIEYGFLRRQYVAGQGCEGLVKLFPGSSCRENSPGVAASTASDVIDARKSIFLVNYDLSDNLLCRLCKKIVTKSFDILCQHS